LRQRRFLSFWRIKIRHCSNLSNCKIVLLLWNFISGWLWSLNLNRRFWEFNSRFVLFQKVPLLRFPSLMQTRNWMIIWHYLLFDWCFSTSNLLNHITLILISRLIALKSLQVWLWGQYLLHHFLCNHTFWLVLCIVKSPGWILSEFFFLIIKLKIYLNNTSRRFLSVQLFSFLLHFLLQGSQIDFFDCLLERFLQLTSSHLIQ